MARNMHSNRQMAMMGGAGRGYEGFSYNATPMTQNLDWLVQPATLAVNFAPDAQGVVTIPLSSLAAQRGGRYGACTVGSRAFFYLFLQ